MVAVDGNRLGDCTDVKGDVCRIHLFTGDLHVVENGLFETGFFYGDSVKSWSEPINGVAAIVISRRFLRDTRLIGSNGDFSFGNNSALPICHSPRDTGAILRVSSRASSKRKERIEEIRRETFRTFMRAPSHQVEFRMLHHTR